MIDLLITILLWFSAMGCGIMAGVYFAFSIFIMRSFSQIPPEAGAAAMQSINVVIVRSIFLPLFFGTSFAALALAILGIMKWGFAESIPMFGGGVFYFIGMFLCTIFLNVPLNNKLAAVDPATAEGANVWAEYLTTWTRWNHIRTVSSTIASALFIAALLAR